MALESSVQGARSMLLPWPSAGGGAKWVFLPPLKLNLRTKIFKKTSSHQLNFD